MLELQLCQAMKVLCRGFDHVHEILQQVLHSGDGWSHSAKHAHMDAALSRMAHHVWDLHKRVMGKESTGCFHAHWVFIPWWWVHVRSFEAISPPLLWLSPSFYPIIFIMIRTLSGPLCVPDRAISVAFAVRLLPISSPLLVILMFGHLETQSLSSTKRILNCRLSQADQMKFRRRPEEFRRFIVVFPFSFFLFSRRECPTQMMIQDHTDNILLPEHTHAFGLTKAWQWVFHFLCFSAHALFHNTIYLHTYYHATCIKL